MVADWSVRFVPDPVSPVVAAYSFPCRVFLLGLATASEKGKFKVAHYRTDQTAALVAASMSAVAIELATISSRSIPSESRDMVLYLAGVNEHAALRIVGNKRWRVSHLP